MLEKIKIREKLFGLHMAALIIKVHSGAEDIQLPLLTVNC